MKRFLRKILKLLLTGLVLYFGNEYFKELIYIESIPTLVLGTLVIFGLGELIGFIVRLALQYIKELSTSDIEEGSGCLGCLSLILIYPLVFLSTPIKLLLVEKMLPDRFVINGFWTYVIISAVFIALSATFRYNKIEEDQEIKEEK